MNTQQRLMARAHTPYIAECFDAFGRLKWRDAFHNLVVTEGLNELLNRTYNAVPADVNWYVGLIGAATGTVAVNSGAAAVTGTSTSFANGDNGSDIIIVGAGASGADFVGTVSGNPASSTSLTLSANAGTTVSGAQYAIEPRAADVMNSKSFNEFTSYSNSTRPAWTKNGAAAAGAMSNSSSKASFNLNPGSPTRVFGAILVANSTKGGTTGPLMGGGLFSGGSRLVQSGDTLNIQVDPSLSAL